MYTLIMSVNEYQYQSEVFKILGLSLMTPFGKLVLTLLENGFENLTGAFYGNSTGSVILLLIGAYFIQIGFEIAQRGDER